MLYELWDVETGNIIGDFDTEAEALATVRDLLALNDPDYADALALGRADASGKKSLIAEGAALAERARAAGAQRRTRSA